MRWLHSTCLWVLALILVLMPGCGGGNDGGTDPGPTEEQLAQIREESETQIGYFNDLVTMAAQFDTTSAIDSLAARMSRDENIAWAKNALTGVSFQWKSGRPGILVIDPRAYKPAVGPPPAELSPGPMPRPDRAAPAGDPLVIPKGRESVFLAPCYSEFNNWDTSLDEVCDTSLVKVGFDDFLFYKDEEVTLSLIRSLRLQDLGILRLSSHGAAWPDTNDIQEVYLITGEAATDAVTAAYFKEINETYTIAISSYAGENRYFVTDEFFRDYVNFGDNKPFVSLGFCFGHRGNWPQTLVNHCGAVATVGWDWAVQAKEDYWRSNSFFTQMCDTSRAVPLTLGVWHAAVAKTYWDYEDERYVNLHYTGPANFALWAKLQIESVDPVNGAVGDVITLSGVGFGAVKGRVFFDQIEAASIPKWTDTEIQVQVPEGLNEGIFALTVKVDDKTSNAVSFSVGGDILAMLMASNRATVDFNALHVLASGFEVEGIFSPYLYNLEWSGTSFSGTDSTHFENLIMVARFSGSIAPDGTTVTLTYVREWSDTYQDGSRESARTAATYTGVPYARHYKEFGVQWVEFEPEGSISGYISGMEHENNYWNSQGELIDSDSYDFTLWGSEGVDEFLRVRLGGMDW